VSQCTTYSICRCSRLLIFTGIAPAPVVVCSFHRHAPAPVVAATQRLALCKAAAVQCVACSLANVETLMCANCCFGPVLACLSCLRAWLVGESCRGFTSVNAVDRPVSRCSLRQLIARTVCDRSALLSDEYEYKAVIEGSGPGPPYRSLNAAMHRLVWWHTPGSWPC
jgi:hypothetical protein